MGSLAELVGNRSCQTVGIGTLPEWRQLRRQDADAPEGTTLPREIARYPQNCLCADRMSAYEQWGMPIDQALANEFRRGWTAISAGETVEGAKRFASGKGRGGSFEDI